MVVAIAVPMAWLRLRTGSVWPAAIMHALHNLPMTAHVGATSRPESAVG
jgi:membrane protease YdiL (CAAX protease family)